MSDKKVRNNFLVQAARSMRRISELENREGFVDSLSELTPDSGLMNSGTQVWGDDITIDTSTSPATFTGSGYVSCWPPIEVFSGVLAVGFALSSGTVTYYIRNTDGKLYAGGGAVVLDAGGITINDNSLLDNQLFTFQSGPDLTDARVSYYFGVNGALNTTIVSGPDSGNDGVTNGDFEAGALTGWTGAGSGTWSIRTGAEAIFGTYGARCVLSGSSSTLTSDRNGSVVADQFYLFRCTTSITSGSYPTAYLDVTIDWYDHISAGSIISTTTYSGTSSPSYPSGADKTFERRVKAPTGTLSAVITFTFHGSAGNTILIDGVQMRQMDNVFNMQVNDTLRVDMPLELTPMLSAVTPNVLNAIQLYVDETTGNLLAMDHYGVTQTIVGPNIKNHYGDYGSSFQNAVSTSPFTMMTRTIKGNSLGTKGQTSVEIDGTVLNNSGAGRAYTFTLTFGSSTIVFTSNFGNSANRSLYYIKWVITNDQATGTQEHKVHFIRSATAASGAAAAIGDQPVLWATTSEDTTADKTMSVSVVSAASTATQTIRGSWSAFGPYYSA